MSTCRWELEVKTKLKIEVKEGSIGVIKALGSMVYFRVKFCKDVLTVHILLLYYNEQASKFYFNVKLKIKAARKEG